MGLKKDATAIRSLLTSPPLGTQVTVRGWVRTRRESKAGLAFVELYDGSIFDGLQLIVPASWSGYAATVPQLYAGVALSARGTVQASPGGKQAVELAVEDLEVHGACDPLRYPLGKQRMSFEHLREVTHLRGRTNTFGAVMRLRDVLAASVHAFFRERGFLWLHTPIITGNDAEGAGMTFRVEAEGGHESSGGDADAEAKERGFFGQPANLTVSGQLEAEAYAMSLGDVYTFGPTFRAENSHTSRHLSEFWMVEPEMAFADLDDDMDLAEAFLKRLLEDALHLGARDLAFFEERVEKGLLARLTAVLEKPFVRMTYTEAVGLLEKSGAAFQYPVSWGVDLQSEHERWLTETHVGGPVILTDYPKDIKAFYMRLNDDGKTVRAMDVLVPGVGEIIGGAQREERLAVLESRMDETGMSREALDWFLDLRRFGTAPHAGFGLGFERLVQFASGMQNIRDVIPFPRAPGLLKV